MNNNTRRRQQNRPTLRNEDLDPALSEISSRVIGCAIEVHKELGPGFPVDVYENAMAFELKRAGVEFVHKHKFPVLYQGETVGECAVSLYVDDRFVVQILTEDREVDGIDRTTLRAHLRAADLGLGLILNFNRRRLKDGGLVRVLNPDKLDQIRGEHAPPPAADEYDDDYEEDDYDDEYDDEYEDD